jgi:hypothetical protein
VIDIPREYDKPRHPDGYLIRRRAVEAGMRPITDLRLAVSIVEVMALLLGAIACSKDLYPSTNRTQRFDSSRPVF